MAAPREPKIDRLKRRNAAHYCRADNMLPELRVLFDYKRYAHRVPPEAATNALPGAIIYFSL